LMSLLLLRHGFREWQAKQTTITFDFQSAHNL
jgi:bisphosphoglycerate-dependent phosphoglycerate mutase